MVRPDKTPHLSLDLWDTVLRRRCHPDEVKLHTAQRMLHLLDAHLIGEPPGTMELLQRRRRIEADIGTRRVRLGLDDEYEIEEVLSACILDAAGRPVEQEELTALTDILVRGEIEQEIAVTWLDEDLVALLGSLSFEKLHIVSDFYMSAGKIAAILEAHSFPRPVDTFFLSCDCSLNKRSGRLFLHVCESLGVEPELILHIGDNPQTDVQMAEKSGLRAYHFVGTKGRDERRRNEEFFSLRQKAAPHAAAALLSGGDKKSRVLAGRRARQELLRSFGRHMSPLFAGFALYIQEICARGGHETVHFFTREGRFFLQVFEQVQRHRLYGMPLVEGRLLPVSRLASFFPSLRELTPPEMMRLWSQYHTQSVTSFLQSLGVDSARYMPPVIGQGIDPEEMISDPWRDERFLGLLANPDFLERLRADHLEKRENLLEFFRDHGFGEGGKACIVDIGWRGTIHDNLALIFSGVRIEGCYLGLQKFFNPQPANTAKHAFMADANKGDDHVMLRYVMPLEMLCFSSGGSATGYRRDKAGKVAAVFRQDPEEDRFHHEWMQYFQEGVLAGIDRVCRRVARHGISIGELRAGAAALADRYITNPPMVMCRAFNAFRQDDTFGMARTILPKESTFRLGDRLLTHVSSARRQRFLDDLERSGWPQCLLRSRYYGLFHQLGTLKRRLAGFARNDSKP